MLNRLFSITIFSALLFGAVQTYAQDDDVFFPEFGFGFQGSFNLSTIDLKPRFNQTYAPGYSGGIVLSYLGERYSGNFVHDYTGTVYSGFQFEFNYNERGWNEKVDTAIPSKLYERKITYAEIPFLTKIIWGKHRVQYQFLIGPYIGILQNNTDNTLTSDSLYIQKYFGRAPDKEFDYGFVVSPGLYLDTKAGNFSLQARYSQGLNRVFDRYQVSPNRLLRRSNNRGWQFMFQYTYHIKSKRTLVYSRTRAKKEEKENKNVKNAPK